MFFMYLFWLKFKEASEHVYECIYVANVRVVYLLQRTTASRYGDAPLIGRRRSKLSLGKAQAKLNR